MLQTPDGNGRLEFFEYIHPEAIVTEPTQPIEIGMHRGVGPLATDRVTAEDGEPEVDEEGDRR